MTKLIRCECGFIARGTGDDEVVGAIRAHMSTDHPDVLAGVDPSDIYGWIEDI
jgi:hypothetical protein